MQQQPLINLPYFRKRNGLKQEDLARLLGLNRSYISLVEIGKGKMPAQRMKAIWALAAEKGWFMDGLLPAYDRLQQLTAEILADASLPAKAKKQFQKDFKSALPPALSEAIQCGQQGIDPVLADKIVAICPPGHVPDREWLLRGDEVLPGADQPGEETLLRTLDQLCRKQEDMEALLLEIKGLLEKR